MVCIFQHIALMWAFRHPYLKGGSSSISRLGPAVHGVPSATSPNPRGPSGARSVQQVQHPVKELVQEVPYILCHLPLYGEASALQCSCKSHLFLYMDERVLHCSCKSHLFLYVDERALLVVASLIYPYMGKR